MNVTLFDYQREPVKKFLLSKRFYLGDPTGSGKTTTTLYAFHKIIEKYPQFKMIVVTPKSVVVQWENECLKMFEGSIKPITITSSIAQEERVARWVNFIKTGDYNCLVISYSMLLKFATRFLDLAQADLIVTFDEATAFKSNKTKAWKTAYLLSKYAKKVWCLSATFIKNKLEEMYNIVQATSPDRLGSRKYFEDNFLVQKPVKKIGSYTIKKVIGYKNLDAFRALISDIYMGRRKSDIAKYMPKLVSKDCVIDLEGPQRAEYFGYLLSQKKIIDELADEIQKLERQARHGIVTDKLEADIQDAKNSKMGEMLRNLTRLQHIIGMPILFNGSDCNNAKLDELHRIFEDEVAEDDRVVIYSKFVKVLEILEKDLKDLGYKVGAITGEKTEEQRFNIQQNFSEGKLNVVLVSNAGSEGINLQAGNMLVFYDLPWSGGAYIQVLGRVMRIGARSENVRVYRLLVDKTIDIYVKAILDEKVKLMDAILGTVDQVSSDNIPAKLLLMLREQITKGRFDLLK